MAFRLILVPIDFDATSERVVDTATELARALAASITLFHVIEVPLYEYANFGGALPSPDAQEAVEASARRALDQKLQAVWATVPSAKAVLTRGEPWRLVSNAITELKADLVVIGTQRRRWLEHALLGSVADKIVRTSPVPVVAVPAPAARNARTAG
jgi:nucleotide-binding universal stress UspA family protein